jgi:hypothetical protein
MVKEKIVNRLSCQTLTLNPGQSGCENFSSKAFCYSISKNCGQDSGLDQKGSKISIHNLGFEPI